MTIIVIALIIIAKRIIMLIKKCRALIIMIPSKILITNTYVCIISFDTNIIYNIETFKFH